MIRSQLETQKMELTKELSSLRLRSVSMEKENLLLRAGAQISALESPEPKVILILYLFPFCLLHLKRL